MSTPNDGAGDGRVFRKRTKSDHTGNQKTLRTHAGIFNRVPLDLPHPDGVALGRPRIPEAIREMTIVIRSRQNVIADYYDAEGYPYEWEELSKEWYPETERQARLSFYNFLRNRNKKNDTAN